MLQPVLALDAVITRVSSAILSSVHKFIVADKVAG